MTSIRFTDASEVPLVGGVVCLDFVNTTGQRESANVRERLMSYEDFLVWSCRVGILDRRGFAERVRDVDRSPSLGARKLRSVIEARESFYHLLRCSRIPTRQDHTKKSSYDVNRSRALADSRWPVVFTKSRQTTPPTRGTSEASVKRIEVISLSKYY